MSRLIVGPFNRVEGDLEVNLNIKDGFVEGAEVNASLFRGFERILAGRLPIDALTITPRICGICSLSQSVASSRALAGAAGVSPADNGRLATNLALAAENIADHITHFYTFFMPDFARDHYQDQPWFADIAPRFKAMKGRASEEVLPARARFMHLVGLLAGKWPHSLAIQPGGMTKPVDRGEQVRLLGIIHDFRVFLEETLFGDDLNEIVGLTSLAALEKWLSIKGRDRSDFSRFLHLARDQKLDHLGQVEGRFMSYGAYPEDKGMTFAQGVWDGANKPLDISAITEDISHSWLEGDEPLKPAEGETRIDADKPGGYSWCKAPRLGGRVMEVGALARQVVDGHSLLLDAVHQQGGSNVYNRVLGRLVEVARTLLAMEGWARALRPREPFCLDIEMPENAAGIGLNEAARGSLGHWISIKDGRIQNYQIIAPTTWNFSPRDGNDVPGVLEQALAGTPVKEGDDTPVLIQHIVRSFDPCMVCTVH